MKKKDEVRLIEVGPRDGFQSVESFIATSKKLEIISALAKTGIKEMEITSFVHPKAIPQMADAGEVAQNATAMLPNDFRIIALVPNLRGAQLAWEKGIKTISYVISVSEAHNNANVASTVETSLNNLKSIIKEFPNMYVRVDLATVFGCPYIGAVSETAVFELAEKCIEAGAQELVVCDTIGTANPRQVTQLTEKILKRIGNIPVTLHLHDTRGLGLVNIYAGYQAGINRFEASIAGLGGCPFAPGAAGNTAMEDVINLFESIGIYTGVSLDGYLEAIKLVGKYVESPIMGRMSKVLKNKKICNN